MHDRGHDRRAHTVSQQSDPIAACPELQAEIFGHAHRAPQLRHLQHAQRRVRAVPLHETKAIQGRQRAQRPVERLVAARLVRSVVDRDEVLSALACGS